MLFPPRKLFGGISTPVKLAKPLSPRSFLTSTTTNEYGITVTAEYAGSYGDIFNKMLPILNTADVPDVVVGYQNQVATYQLADAMFDMNELIDHPKYGLTKEEQKISSPLLRPGRSVSVWQSAPRPCPQPLSGSEVLQHGLADRTWL
jgi:hypothetical protein